MKIRHNIYGLAAMTMLLAACAESELAVEENVAADESSIIHIGGIQNTELETSLGGYTTRTGGNIVTRAGNNTSVDAETVEWLLGPLFGGLDITYGAKGKPETEKVAILKLLKRDGATGNTFDDIKYSQYSTATEKIAEYSFKYRNADGTVGDDAKWYDNGEHYFQGVFVPGNLRYLPEATIPETPETVNNPTNGKAKNLKVDQSKNGNDDNYTLLARYLGMPADASIHATVGRVKLPFRHRLARVIAYVLIDPTMGSDVTIQGYSKDTNGRDDAKSSEIRFCNVKVLAGVHETDDPTSGHATLTPQWDEARKVIPHFVEESVSKSSKDSVMDSTNFIMFYNTELKTFIFPANDKLWVDANTEWNRAYTTAYNNSEYSELSESDRSRKAANDADKNSGYERTLYGKVPVYDLIVRPTYKSEEMVMYDEANVSTKRAELAAQTNKIDFEITLSNGLQYTKTFEFDLDANYQTIVYLRINRESIDYNSSGADKWSEETGDDDYYGVNNQNGNTLSITGSSWQRAYRFKSYNPGVTDGHYYGQQDNTDPADDQDSATPNGYQQYVTQTQWLEMFAKAHEGGLHHGDYFILDSDITIDATKLPDNFVFTGHLDGQDHTITLTGMGETVVDQPAWVEDNYELATADDYNGTLYVQNGSNYDVFSIPSPLYILVPTTYYTSEDPEVINGEKNVGDEKVAEHYEESTPSTVADLMYGEYYEKNADGSYSIFKPTLYANHPIHHDAITHTSGTTLFAGLNGAYSASVGQANVHLENGVYVPYVDATTGTGWRAEVINTRISGAGMFPEAAIKADGNYDVTKVSGYIYNCWQVEGETKTAIKGHTPTLPKYN